MILVQPNKNFLICRFYHIKFLSVGGATFRRAKEIYQISKGYNLFVPDSAYSNHLFLSSKTKDKNNKQK
ncbi:hypothetical protein OSO01_33630 [Oceanobacillus sojae]|uniref:Uncharacterized protein n=1 Tax=Oceanobacillus sojae TaxID=582851 RepID=A0A511ZME9_9BACI|nr:hypothetical protein OSO01_33630 [Oceanobacillus sojae]